MSPTSRTPTPAGLNAVPVTRQDEEREKDLVTFRLGEPRRNRTILITALASAGAEAAGWLDLGMPLIVGVLIASLTLNWILTRAALGSRGYRWWHRYAFATFDVALISMAPAQVGDDRLILFYLVAGIP